MKLLYRRGTGHRDAIRTRRSMNLFSLYPGICIDRANFHRGKPRYHVELFFCVQIDKYNVYEDSFGGI